MLAASMFSKLKSSSSTNTSDGSHVLENNPILQYFTVGKQICSAGPELAWKIYQAVRKSDGKEASVFVFEKRLTDRLSRGRRKDSVSEIMRRSVKHLEVYRQPKLILTVLHGAEESNDTIAFASEPVLASLANIMAYHMSCSPSTGGLGSLGIGTTTPGGSNMVNEENYPPIPRPAHAKEYHFIDFEIKYGLRQVAEALDFLNTQVYHHNICPSSILVTKLGNWKLAGMEFIISVEKGDRAPCQAWSSRVGKVAQPDLDYVAPEVQAGYCGSYSDIYSLGLLIFTIFNRGRPIFQANHSNSSYHKQLEMLEDNIANVLIRLPVQLQDMVTKMLSRDIHQRPSAKTLLNTPYFSDRYVETLQNLDVINLRDPMQKSHFYRVTLREALPYLPRKIWFQRVWPFLQEEMKSTESLAAALHSVIFLIQEATPDEYEEIILPELRKLLNIHRSVQATVTILEHLHVILEKSTREEIRKELFPVLYRGLESNSIQIQNAALTAVTNVSDYLEEMAIRRMVIPKIKHVYDNNITDMKVLLNILNCVEKIIDKLEKQQILDDVLPLILDFKLQETEIIIKVVGIYRTLLSDKKYGLTVNLLATQVIPALTPNTINPSLTLEGFQALIEALQEMLNTIDRNQRNILKLDTISAQSPDRHRPLRHLCSSDNMHAPPFNIPNLRIEQRKTSSAEDMARKNSTGSSRTWWFGMSPSSPDCNFLRVINSFPNRRLSDNTLITPKIRVAPSCASSPGGTPGGSNSGLPIRRHSSIGAQERRGSNMSPPTGLHHYSNTGSRDGSTLSVPSSCLSRVMIGGSMPNTSSSSPYLWSPNMGALGRSRRPSTCMSSGSGPQSAATALLQQISSSVGRPSITKTFTSSTNQTFVPGQNK